MNDLVRGRIDKFSLDASLAASACATFHESITSRIAITRSGFKELMRAKVAGAAQSCSSASWIS
jgi:hypothetical protein